VCGTESSRRRKALGQAYPTPPEPPEDPVSTAFDGVTGGDELRCLENKSYRVARRPIPHPGFGWRDKK